jgi:hypothetical protein
MRRFQPQLFREGSYACGDQADQSDELVRGDGTKRFRTLANPGNERPITWGSQVQILRRN